MSATHRQIDAVILCGEKDAELLEPCIESLRTHCSQIRRIIVVSARPFSSRDEWFDEKVFPFSPADIEQELAASPDAIRRRGLGWYYQQLLKLYSPYVIPGLLEDVLVVDSDTIWLKDVSFVDESGKACLNVGTAFDDPFNQVIKSFLKIEDEYVGYNGVAHHILLNKTILSKLFELVETSHGKPAWKGFLSLGHYLSEYNLYFKFAINLFPKMTRIVMRPFKNTGSMEAPSEASHLVYLAVHSHRRTPGNDHWPDVWA